MDEFIVRKLFDAHVHFREGDMLRTVAPITARYCSHALVMPNLSKPVRTWEDIHRYREEIKEAVGKPSGFTPLMTFKILPNTTPQSVQDIARCCPESAAAGKVYPYGLTTNAQDGVTDYFALFDVFSAMVPKFVLSLHGEKPGKHIIGRDREHAFLRTLRLIACTFPKLRIVLEHITTAAAVDAILGLPENVAATITVHHLLLTHDDVGSDRMCPNHYCKPIAKDPADRDALIEAATSGCPKFFFGSDSAPHPREGKARLHDCCAGIFTAPVALPLLVEVFEKHDALSRLEAFTSGFGRQFYGIPTYTERASDLLHVLRKPWTVPEEIGGIVPFYAGKELPWQIME